MIALIPFRFKARILGLLVETIPHVHNTNMYAVVHALVYLITYNNLVDDVGEAKAYISGLQRVLALCSGLESALGLESLNTWPVLRRTLLHCYQAEAT